MGRRRYWLMLLPLVVFLIGTAALQTAVVPALPSIQREHGVSTSTVAWVLTLTVLVSSVATPILGRLGDMFGKRRVLLGMGAVTTLGCLLAALSESFASLLVGRGLQGFSAGAFSICLAVVRDEVPPTRRAMVYGVVTGMWGVGAAAAFPLSGLIVDNLSYRWIFWIAAGVFVLSCIAVRAWVPESPVRSPGRIDWIGALLFMPGLGAILLALSQGIHWGWDSGRTLGAFAVGAGLVGAWAAWELRVEAPLTDLRLLASRSVWTVNTSVLLVSISMYTVFLVTPKIVQASPENGYGFGASATEAGAFLIPMAVTQLVGSFLVGPVVRRFGSKSVNLAGCACMLGAFVVFDGALDHRWGVLLAVSLVGFGIGLAATAAAHLISLAVSQAQTAEANSVMTMLRNVGGSTGATIVATTLAAYATAGSHVTTRTGYTVTFAIAGAALVAALVVGSLVPDARSDRSGAQLAGSRR
jgi:MFS family permease